MKFNFKQISAKSINLFLKKSQSIILAVVSVVLLGLCVVFYYKFIYKTFRTETSSDVMIENIDEETLQKVLDNLQTRKDILKRVQKTFYPNLFN